VNQSTTLATRRRSPWWVREMTSLSLHRLAGKLYNEFRTDGITAEQSKLLDAVISELEYRQRRLCAPDRCTCMFCCSPFPEDATGP